MQRCDFPRETGLARRNDLEKGRSAEPILLDEPAVSQASLETLTDLLNRRDQVEEMLALHARYVFGQLRRGRPVEKGVHHASIARRRGFASVCWSLTVNGRLVHVDG